MIASIKQATLDELDANMSVKELEDILNQTSINQINKCIKKYKIKNDFVLELAVEDHIEYLTELSDTPKEDFKDIINILRGN